MSTNTFHIVDYIVFGITLLLSLLIGVFHACKAKRQQAEKHKQGKDEGETDDYLMGGRSMPVFPVVLSTAASVLSGIAILGIPGEIYKRGALMWLDIAFGTLSSLVGAYVVLPVIYRLGPVSINEYVGKRFQSQGLRKLSSVLFLFTMAFYMGIVIYAPSIALSGVTNIAYEPLIVVTGLVCTVYTTIGGLKAVVWTDTIQAVFMYGGIITLIIRGTIEVGGLGRVFEIAYESGRISPLWNFDPNPVQYFSFWIAMIGGFAYGGFGINQMASQRYCSMATFKQARQVVFLTIPVYLIFITLCCFMGLVSLAFFWGCDPLATKEIQSQDQIVILMVMRTMGGLPGMPGLFLACLYSGTLSTVSSAINSMTAVTWEDFLKSKYGHLTDHKHALITKGISVIYGVMSIGVAFLAGSIGSIVGATLNTLGALSGPTSGLFLIGMIMPKARKLCAFVAVITGAAFSIWLSLGNMFTKPYSKYSLATSTEFCAVNDTIINTNSTQSSLMQLNSTEIDDPLNSNFGNKDVFALYRISTFLYPAIGVCITLLVGFLMSFWRQTDENDKHVNELTIQGVSQLNKVHAAGGDIQLKAFEATGSKGDIRY